MKKKVELKKNKKINKTQNDVSLVKRFKDKISRKMPIVKVILFGSRARGETREWSDYDILLVSEEFKGVVSYKRAPKIYDYWNHDYPVDFLCYTNEEFNRMKKKATIVREAVKEGIEIK